MEKHRKAIHDFWKPDGEQVHVANEAAVKEWMQAHGFDTRPGALSVFLHDKVHDSARRALAVDLKTVIADRKGRRT
jgi:hypothetical protein